MLINILFVSIVILINVHKAIIIIIDPKSLSSSRHPFPSWYTCISYAIRWTLLNFDIYLKISQLLKWCLHFAFSFLFHVCLLLFKLFVVYCNMLLLSPFVVCYESLLLLLFVVNCLNVVVGGGAAVCCYCICQLKVICILLIFYRFSRL